MKECTSVILYDPTIDSILLLLRTKTDSFYPNVFCLPGGGVDPGEDIYTGALRELQEETGVRLFLSDICYEQTIHDGPTQIHYFSFLTVFKGLNITLNPKEHSAYDIVAVDKLSSYDMILQLGDHLEILMPILNSKIKINTSTSI